MKWKGRSGILCDKGILIRLNGKLYKRQYGGKAYSDVRIRMLGSR